ncbi:acetyltransferase [Methylocystis sp. 9N]|uniref:Acetyltransferase n=1 Tax=Methylocystis borbori TaxID=3118750 RepID=A0ABU7XD58_9HYPH
MTNAHQDRKTPVLAPIVIIGSGGHAKVVIELARATGLFEVVGCTDPEPGARAVLGAPILGADDILPNLLERGVRAAAVALGANHVRARVIAKLHALGFELPALIHPRATISPSAVIGAGSVVMAGVVVNADARIGAGCIINTGATIDHDANIGQCVHIAPGSTLAGCVTIGDRTFLGAGTVVIPNIEIGADVIVGAGAVVVRPIAANAKAYGVPARLHES